MSKIAPFIRVAAVDEDMSAHGLQDYLNAGIREVVWEYGYESWADGRTWREMGGVCPICFALDGQHFKIDWVLSNMTHNAPKYTLSHVGCKCRLRPQTREQEILDYPVEQKLPEGWIDPSTISEWGDEAAPEESEVEMEAIPSPG